MRKAQKHQLTKDINGPKRKLDAPKCIAPTPAAKLDKTTTVAA